MEKNMEQNMIVHYLKDVNEIREGNNGRYIVSSGKRKGVLVATGPGEVGWSLWNEKAEIEEFINTHYEYWISHGMGYVAADEKAEKLAKTKVRFDRELAISIAFDHLKTPPPASIERFHSLIVERSMRYFKA